MKSLASSQAQCAIAHDTLQQLSYAKRPAFNILWEPKDIISINVKAIEKKRILGDEYLETIIKERPKRYMTPSISLDAVQDKDTRKLIIDFIYKTMTNQAAREVWTDFKTQSLCLLKKHVEKQEKPLIEQQIISRLPVRFQRAARKWDSMQNRSFLVGDTCYDKKENSKNQFAKSLCKQRDIRERAHDKGINQ